VTLHKDLNLVSEYQIRGKNVDVSFTPYLTKKQKKQLSNSIPISLGPRVVELHCCFYLCFLLFLDFFRVLVWTPVFYIYFTVF